MKRRIATFLTVVFVLAVFVSLFAIIQHISEQPSADMSDISVAVSDTSGGTLSTDISTGGEESDVSDNISEDVPQDSIVSFLACPDNIIHPSVFLDAINRAAAKNGVTPSYTNLGSAEYDFYPIYEYVAADIAAADIAYINVETLIGGNHRGIRGYPMFNTPEAAGETLYKLGFDIFNVAHNHMLDSGDDSYLKFCHDFFTDKGGTVIGYYKNQAAIDDIVIIEKEGIKIALLAYTYSTNGIPLPAGSSTYIPLFDKALISRQVAIAKEKADVIIVSAHWGNEDTYSPNSYQREYAQHFVDLGVDVVIGMHSHSIQPMKWVENDEGHRTLLVYSLGNFVSGMRGGINMLGGMLGFDIIRDAETGEVYVENAVFMPIVTHYTKPGGGVISIDTGYRDFKIYHLEDYTEALADEHGVRWWERSNSPTLVGGKFSKENMIKTLKQYIPQEFLPDYYKN